MFFFLKSMEQQGDNFFERKLADSGDGFCALGWLSFVLNWDVLDD